MQKKPKTICLCFVGADRPEITDVQIVDGTTPKDFKNTKALKIPESAQLYRPATGKFLEDDDNLYALLKQGEKVQVSPKATLGVLGDGIFSIPSLFFLFLASISILISFLFWRFKRRKRIKVLRTVKLSSISPITVYPGNAPHMATNVRHERIRKPVPPATARPSKGTDLDTEMNEIGWQRQGRNYEGYLRDGRGNEYSAELRHKWGKKWELYVKDPPKEIFKGEHGLCFSHVGNGWHHVHFWFSGYQSPLSKIHTTSKYIVSCTGHVPSGQGEPNSGGG